MAMPPIPPLEVDHYNWQQRSDEPAVWSRRACGVEKLVGDVHPNTVGEFDIYLAPTFVSNISINADELEEHIVAAFVSLRHTTPETAATVGRNETVRTSLVHRPPKNTEEAVQWAKSRVKVDTSGRDAFAIRAAIEDDRLKNPHALDSFSVHVLVPQDKRAALKGVPIELLFACNHLFYDGPGARIAVADFFKHLTNELSGNGQKSFDWAESYKSLTKPATAFIVDELTTGPEYEALTQAHLMRLMVMMKGHASKPRSLDVASPRTVFTSFTEEQTQKLLAAIKTELGPGHTITQLTYASLLFTTLATNPLPTENGSAEGEPPYSSPFVTVDGRRYAEKDAKILSFQLPDTAVLPNIRRFDRWQERTPEQIRDALLTATKDMKKVFDTVLSKKSPISTSITTMDFMANMLESYVIHVEYHDANTGSGQVGASVLLVPTLHGDGIYERTLDSDYTTASGEPVLSLTNCKMLVNHHKPYMALRIGNFRKKVLLSCDYNLGSFTVEDATRVVDQVKETMLRLI